MIKQEIAALLQLTTNRRPSMNYNTFSRITSKTGRVQLADAYEVARALLFKAQRAATDEEFDDEEFNESAELFEKFFDLADIVLNAKVFVGSADDVHNLAVEYARANAEDYACKILEKGIEAFGDSIDLLADYLEYGSKSGQMQRCAEIFEKLVSIPKEYWNWRAFQFSINYKEVQMGIDKSVTKQRDALKAEIFNLAKEFETYLPDEEKAHLSKATIVQSFGDPNKAESIRILEAATGSYNAIDDCNSDDMKRYGKSKLSKAPKCSLQLASILFERGDFNQALVLLEKTKLDNLEVQPSVNRAYVYALSALCKMAKYFSEYKNKAINGGANDENQSLVLSVYKDFEVAQVHSRYEKFVDDIESLVTEFETITEVSNPYK
jgi:tetratricopeptide (TPR) repeat protein